MTTDPAEPSGASQQRLPAEMSSDGHVAVITGAARGIGAATAFHLAGLGWRVALVDIADHSVIAGYRTAEWAQLQMAGEHAEDHRHVLPDLEPPLLVRADVRDADALDAAVAEVVDRWGRIDAAVAAAGIIAGGPKAWETDVDVWRQLHAVNLDGVFHLARSTVPHLRQAPHGGRFVAVSSAAGVTGLPQLAAYTAAKHGVVGLVRAMAKELAAEGVAVNAVLPGSTDTDMLRASAVVYDLADPAELIAHQPSGRVIEPDEVGRTIAWLCTAAPSSLTGAVVPVDGGLTA